MNILSEYVLKDLEKKRIPYEELQVKYQDALETILYYKEYIYELKRDLDDYEKAYENSEWVDFLRASIIQYQKMECYSAASGKE